MSPATLKEVPKKYPIVEYVRIDLLAIVTLNFFCDFFVIFTNYIYIYIRFLVNGQGKQLAEIQAI